MAKFANKPKGRPSKRQDLSMKYKIGRKVRDHNKKVKKEAKKMKTIGMFRKKGKENDIPNSYPFKQQEIELMRSKMAEQKTSKKPKASKPAYLESKQQGDVELTLVDVKSNMYESNAKVTQAPDYIVQDNSFVPKQEEKYNFKGKRGKGQ